jgi:hypothetical protein
MAKYTPKNYHEALGALDQCRKELAEARAKSAPDAVSVEELGEALVKQQDTILDALEPFADWDERGNRSLVDSITDHIRRGLI